ncbi:MAG: response regulator [Pseudomonadota bacterium]
MAQNKGVAITFSDVSKVKYTEKGMSVAYKQLRTSINNAIETLDTAPFTDKVNILIVDDQAADLALIENELKSIEAFSVKVHQAKTVKSALAKIVNNTVDVCIVDYNLKMETALDLIDIFSEKNIQVPIIVVTATAHDNDLNALLLSHGAMDFINKGEISAPLLSRSVRYAIRRQQIDDEIDHIIEAASENEQEQEQQKQGQEEVAS